MPSMREQLEKKTDAATSRLAVLAFEELKKANRSPGVAVEGFVPQVLADAELIVALMRAIPQQLRVAAMAYLYERVKDMDRQVHRGASQGCTESQAPSDRPSTPQPDDARASQTGAESHPIDDRPASPNGGRPSPGGTESHPSVDRPAPRPKAPAAKSKISKGAALAYASSSIFARPIGSGIKMVGKVTKFDIIQIKRRAMIDDCITDGLLEFEWPDEDRTTLDKIATEKQVEAIFARAYRKMDSLGVTNVNR